MPSASARNAAQSASSSVAGRRSAISDDTLRPWRRLSPNSPCTALPTKRANCTGNGLSRPRSARNCSRCCGVASWPRMFVTGSPTYWNSMNAMKATVSITITAGARRRRTKTSIRDGTFQFAITAKREPTVKGECPDARPPPRHSIMPWARSGQRKSRPKAAFGFWRRLARASDRSEEVTDAEIGAGRLAAQGRQRANRAAAAAVDLRLRQRAVLQTRNGRVQRGALRQVVHVASRVLGDRVRGVRHSVLQLAALATDVDLALADRDHRAQREAVFLLVEARVAQGVTLVVTHQLGNAQIVRRADVEDLLLRLAQQVIALLGERAGDVERTRGEADAATDVAAGVRVRAFAGGGLELTVDATDVGRQQVRDHVRGAHERRLHRRELRHVGRVADAVGAERVKNGLVPEGHRVVATEADFTEAATQAHRRAAIPELRTTSGVAGIGGDTGVQVEAGPQTAAQIFLAGEHQLAAVEAAVGHRQTARLTVVLHIASGQVDGAVQRDRRLSRCHTSESAQNCESEQRFFHCNYLLG